MRQSGGEYSGDLTKSITHLIASGPTGNKYKFAKQWNLKLVSQEWLIDSVERGMILNEELYHPEMAAEERGKGAWVRKRITTPSKREREESMGDVGARKMRRTLSTKLQSQNEAVWGDILGSANNGQTVVGRKRSITDTNADSSLHTMSARTDSSATIGAHHIETNKQGTFNGCRFYIHGFGRKLAETMRKHLVSHDADVVATMDLVEMPHSGRSYIVVPHQTKAEDLPACVPPAVSVVTEWWVERCLEAKTCLDPSAAKFDLPFPHPRIENFENIVVSSTGFGGYQLLHLSRVVDLMGGKYDEYFTRNSSVLICNMQRQVRVEKLEITKEWQIPAVTIDWLLESIRTSTKQPYKLYFIRQKRSASGSIAQKMPPPEAIRESFDGIDKSTTEFSPLPASVAKPQVSEAKKTAQPAATDTTAVDDDDDDVETLDELFKKNRVASAKARSAQETTASTTAPANAEEAPPPMEEDDGFAPPPEDEPFLEPTESEQSASGPPAPAAVSPTTTKTSPMKLTSPTSRRTVTSPAKPLQSPARPSPRKPSFPSVPSLDTQEIRQTITSLLTRGKSKQIDPEPPRSRRILGRAQSNISTLSSAEDGGRARTPVDKRPFTGNGSAVRSGSLLSKADSTGSIVEQLFAQEGEDEGEGEESQPTQTQKVVYHDEEAEREREEVVARVSGRKVVTPQMERKRVVTMGSVTRERRTRRNGEGLE